MAPSPAAAPAPPSARRGPGGMSGAERRIVAASSVGTIFEWYDFYLYASLAPSLGRHFFTADETNPFALALLAYAAGFAVRPLGALYFGRIGDLSGRKRAFLATLLLTGISTTAVGFLPAYATIGLAAPVLLVALRILQGLALGGEYGGSATYVAEHAPDGKRGLYTSWIQTTATAGLFLSLVVVLACRWALGPAFETWGWRLPFLFSAPLLAVSLYIRLRLLESPIFRRMKEEGKASRAPLTESFLRWGNLRVVLLSMFGAVAGQSVVWYTGMVLQLLFLTETLKVDPLRATLMSAAALALATPFFVVFGALSDRVGRKPVVLLGCALAAVLYHPVFRQLTRAANPAVFQAARETPVTVVANERECAFQFDPLRNRKFPSSCDVARGWLARHGVPYGVEPAPAGVVARVRVGDKTVVESFDGTVIGGSDFRERSAAFAAEMDRAIRAAGYPASADPARVDVPRVVGLLFVLALLVTIVYAPIAAWLVELFPARIRYTSVSLPYHVGNGWFGGFVPPIAFGLVAATGDIYYGLWYPITIAAMTFVVGMLFMPETKDREIHHRA